MSTPSSGDLGSIVEALAAEVESAMAALFDFQNALIKLRGNDPPIPAMTTFFKLTRTQLRREWDTLQQFLQKCHGFGEDVTLLGKSLRTEEMRDCIDFLADMASTSTNLAKVCKDELLPANQNLLQKIESKMGQFESILSKAPVQTPKPQPDDGFILSTRDGLTAASDTRQALNRIYHHLQLISDFWRKTAVDCRANLEKDVIRITPKRAELLEKIWARNKDLIFQAMQRITRACDAVHAEPVRAALRPQAATFRDRDGVRPSISDDNDSRGTLVVAETPRPGQQPTSSSSTPGLPASSASASASASAFNSRISLDVPRSSTPRIIPESLRPAIPSARPSTPSTPRSYFGGPPYRKPSTSNAPPTIEIPSVPVQPLRIRSKVSPLSPREAQLPQHHRFPQSDANGNGEGHGQRPSTPSPSGRSATPAPTPIHSAGPTTTTTTPAPERAHNSRFGGGGGVGGFIRKLSTSIPPVLPRAVSAEYDDAVEGWRAQSNGPKRRSEMSRKGSGGSTSRYQDPQAGVPSPHPNSSPNLKSHHVHRHPHPPTSYPPTSYPPTSYNHSYNHHPSTTYPSQQDPRLASSPFNYH